MLYKLNAQYMKMIRPWHDVANITRQLMSHPINPFADHFYFRTASASIELFERLTTDYEEPEWGLNSTTINNKKVPISQNVVFHKPYCNLLHFKRDKPQPQQTKVLLIAPMSGHFATLLRSTVKEFLPDHETYITDWRNARDVPLSAGSFSFDDYVTYLIEFITFLGPDTHVIAVCQPCVPAMVALSVMHQENDNNIPKSLTLMGGPIDARISPTDVNDYAGGKDLEWFDKNVICTVPANFSGQGQKVYPGFIQLSAFLSMNMDNHVNKHVKFFNDLVAGDGDSAEDHRLFYNEYLAVMDMPADYYLDTIRKVFLEHQLPKGTIEYRGKKIDLGSVTKTALLTIEGENDDITGCGQTSVALDLCSNLATNKKKHYEQPGVGHYGIFNGRKYREIIAPMIKDFIKEHSKKLRGSKKD
ncbi:MAG: polyhydroxyalkanoate depolymerase [Oleispira antarctica]|nr:polyhydroxyalkanoate depolymerase [Oleispira antarctica]MBQ0791709.1 polyhydroxyalkanoate depolymerase [Oleispira antarctica]